MNVPTCCTIVSQLTLGLRVECTTGVRTGIVGDSFSLSPKERWSCKFWIKFAGKWIRATLLFVNPKSPGITKLRICWCSGEFPDGDISKKCFLGTFSNGFNISFLFRSLGNFKMFLPREQLTQRWHETINVHGNHLNYWTSPFVY